MEEPGWEQWGHELQAWAGGNVPASGAWGCPGMEMLSQTQSEPHGFPGGPVGQYHSAPLHGRETFGDSLLPLLGLFDGCGKTVRLSFSISTPLLIYKTEGEEGNTLLGIPGS